MTDQLTGFCRQTLGTETGVGVISHRGNGLLNNIWLVWPLDAAGSGTWFTGPNLAQVPVITSIGPTFDNPITSSAANSIVKFNCDNTKVAHPYQQTPWLAVPINGSELFIYDFNPVTCVLSNVGSQNIHIQDLGIIAPAAVGDYTVRFIDLAWNRTAALTHYVYVQYFNHVTSAIEIRAYWPDITNTPVLIATVPTTLYDATGTEKRFITGMVTDPFNDRILVLAPHLISNTLPGVSKYADYPGYYQGNVISCIEGLEDPGTVAPTWTQSYFDISVFSTRSFTKGTPNVGSCGAGVLAASYYVKPCSGTDVYLLDSNNDFWSVNNVSGTVQLENYITTSLFPVVCTAPCNSIVSVKFDHYNALMYILCEDGAGVYCFNRYDKFSYTGFTNQGITIDAFWGGGTADFKAMAVYKANPAANTIGAFDPDMCTDVYFLGEINVAGRYAIAVCDFSPNPANATIATGVASPFFTPVLPPTGLVILDEPAIGTGVAMVIAGKHIWRQVWPAGAWVDLGDRCTPVGETNDLIDFQIGSLTDPLKLYAYTQDTRWDVDLTTGVLSNGLAVTYLVNGLPFAGGVKSVMANDMGTWDIPLKVTSADWPDIDTLCLNNSVWTWSYDIGGGQDYTVGACFECTDSSAGNEPEWADILFCFYS